MFYELNSWDPAGTTPWKRDTAEGELSGTFYGDMLILAKITRLMDPNAELHHDNDNKNKRSLASRADVVDYLVPYGYARVFHPQIALHKKIASLVALQMFMEHDSQRGYAEWTDLNKNTYCPLEPEEPEPPKETPVRTKKWSMQIHPLYPGMDSVYTKDCERKDSRKSRTVWGYELNKCYDFREMPDTDCREYIGTKEQGGCSGGLSPHSVLVPDEGYNCIFYFGGDCTRPFDRTSDHTCMSTNTGDGWVSNQIGSFRCLEEKK
ncbi:hypothetical protein FVEN_g5620 [Fusarium venenatum]|uniref:uncharacterized protein n=1 Tax=Fusarium venenatum TaxID=56646 RepID=UPI001DC58F58|nr:hypothetical protein FVEN_g5620 [Fusarium venenatum]KAH7003003.1 hypothetical protein EDB82DRAFT_531478 [Fusarium venenatum]